VKFLPNYILFQLVITMLKLNHKNLDVWKISLKLIKLLYGLTEKYPKTEIYGMVSQIRRAAVSVSLNIAEGAARRTQADRKRFYEVSRSSLVEIDTQLEISLQLDFVKVSEISEIDETMNHLFAKVTNFIN